MGTQWEKSGLSLLQETPMGTYWETLLFFACLGNRWEGVGTLVGNAPIPTNLPQNSFQCIEDYLRTRRHG
eukprot:scaffold10100_cov93-Skeletonema_marinoi.AAC.2